MTRLPLTSGRRVSPRQITVMVVAVCAAVIATPIAARAATALFTSSSANAPAVTAKNSASGAGAKAVYGNASARSGKVYGLYGHTNSGGGYGVYSAGRLGSSGALVCSHCVTGGDVNAATFPRMPNSDQLGGHGPTYFARFVPLFSVIPAGQGEVVARVGSVEVDGLCTGSEVKMFAHTHGPGATGTLNWFTVTGSTATASGVVLGGGGQVVAKSVGAEQTEGTAIYRDGNTWQIVTINFHLFGAGCQLFGDMLTDG